MTMDDTLTAELFDALTGRLTEIFESDAEYAAKTGYGDQEKLAAGVSRVVKIVEALQPTYEDPAARSLEITYLDRDEKERVHYLWEITLEELLRGSGARVPDYELTWTMEL